MQPGTWVLLTIVIVAMLTPAIVIAITLWRSRLTWRKVDLVFSANPLVLCKYQLAGPVTDLEASNAFFKALSALQFVWPDRDLWAKPIRIHVMNRESWLNSANVMVGGEQDGDIVRVNVSLTSLCHELAHFYEMQFDGAHDYTHDSWTAKRIWTADEDYRRTLR